MELSKELEKKVLNAIQNQRLIGNVKYTDQEYRELVFYTKKYSLIFAQGGCSYLKGKEEIHFVTLVEIAKRWKVVDTYDGDRGFWLFIYETLEIKSEYQAKIYREYVNIIDNLGIKKVLVANTKKKYYATLIMHALAPKNSIFAFFDLAYNIYKKDLDFNYTENDKEICLMAMKCICEGMKKITNREIPISIGSSQYKIQIGLRSMALGSETQSDFIDLLDRALIFINKMRYHNKCDDIDYFSHLISQWWKEKNTKLIEEERRREEPAVTKQTLAIKFLHKNNAVYLIIPPIRFEIGEYPELFMKIYVGENDKVAISKEIFTVNREVTLTSQQQEIELNTLLKGEDKIKCRIEITENGKIVFNKSLNKNFILFHKEHEVLKVINKPDNYFLYSLNIDDLQLPSEIYTVETNLYNIYPKIGEIVGDTIKQVYFIKQEITKFDNLMLLGDIKHCEWRFSEKSYKVFGEKVFVLVPNNISLNSLDLEVNGCNILLSDNNLVQNDVEQDGYFIYDITNKISQNVPIALTVYSYIKENFLICDDIIVIPKLQVDFSKPIFYGSDETTVIVYYEDKSYYLDYNNANDEIIYSLLNGALAIKIPWFKWRIDFQDWHNEPIKEKIWYKNYFDNGSVIEFLLPHDMDSQNIKLYCDINGVVEEIAGNVKNTRFDIGRFIYSHEGNEQKFYIEINDCVERIEICTVATSEYFTQMPLEVVDGVVRFMKNKYFVGNKKRQFLLDFRCIGKSDVHKISTDLINEEIPEIGEGIYWVKIVSLEKGLFVNKESLFWEGEFVVGDKEKLKLINLVLKVNPIFGIETDTFWRSRKSGYYISRLERINNEDTYRAVLSFKDVKGEKQSIAKISKCQVVIQSEKSLKITVPNQNGEYIQYLKRDSFGKLQILEDTRFPSIKNYNYVEVSNV